MNNRTSFQITNAEAAAALTADEEIQTYIDASLAEPVNIIAISLSQGNGLSYLKVLTGTRSGPSGYSTDAQLLFVSTHDQNFYGLLQTRIGTAPALAVKVGDLADQVYQEARGIVSVAVIEPSQPKWGEQTNYKFYQRPIGPTHRDQTNLQSETSYLIHITDVYDSFRRVIDKNSAAAPSSFPGSAP